MDRTLYTFFKTFVFILLITGWGFFAVPPLVAQQTKTYQQTISLGDKYLKENKLLEAKAYYQMALSIKKGDAYAKEKIGEIAKKLKEKMKSEEKYYDIIDRADDFFEQNSLDAALQQYQESLKFIPNDDYALKKIAEIHKLKTEQKGKQDSYSKALAEGENFLQQKKYDKALVAFKTAHTVFSDKDLPNQKIKQTQKLLAKYQNEKKRADEEIVLAKRYLLIKNYAMALEHYEKADSLLPDDPKIAQEIIQIKPKAGKQAAYNKKTQEADNLYIGKSFGAAKQKYLEAEILWPENSYSKEMIEKIDTQLAHQKLNLEENYKSALVRADSLFAIKEFDNAKAEYNLALSLKPDEKYPENKLKIIGKYYQEQKRKSAKNYASEITGADSLFNIGKYKEAALKYEKAREVKPDDAYIKKQLKVINAKLEAFAAKEKVDLKFSVLVAYADSLFNEGQYELALGKYKEAQTLKSTAAYPPEKIKQIANLLANATKQKELEKKYQSQIILATRLIQDEKLGEAKKAFENALTFKPDAQLPNQKITEIDSLLAQKQVQEKVDKAYKQTIMDGDLLLQKKNFEKALFAYQRANKLKPDEAYALKQIASVNKTILSIAKVKAQQKAYEQSIAEGDSLLLDKKYELAKVEYQKALKIKIGEHYPRQKIAEIDSTLTRLEKEKEQRYQQALTKADNLYSQQNYKKALIKYKEASIIKPNEEAPIKKIELCNSFIAKELEKLKVKYDLAVADADKLYAAKIYDKAIKNYQKAATILPDKTYPAGMIAKITRFIENNAITDVINSPVTIAASQTKKFDFKPLPINVRKSNYILVKAHNTGKGSFKVIFTYGSDNGKNGGFVISVPDDTRQHDFIIRVGNQYKWFSDNNNWISIYPENGNIEISLLRISRSN